MLPDLVSGGLWVTWDLVADSGSIKLYLGGTTSLIDTTYIYIDTYELLMESMWSYPVTTLLPV